MGWLFDTWWHLELQGVCFPNRFVACTQAENRHWHSYLIDCFSPHEGKILVAVDRGRGAESQLCDVLHAKCVFRRAGFEISNANRIHDIARGRWATTRIAGAIVAGIA